MLKCPLCRRIPNDLRRAAEDDLRRVPDDLRRAADDPDVGRTADDPDVIISSASDVDDPNPAVGHTVDDPRLVGNPKAATKAALKAAPKVGGRRIPKSAAAKAVPKRAAKAVPKGPPSTVAAAPSGPPPKKAAASKRAAPSSGPPPKKAAASGPPPKKAAAPSGLASAPSGPPPKKAGPPTVQQQLHAAAKAAEPAVATAPTADAAAAATAPTADDVPEAAAREVIGTLHPGFDGASVYCGNCGNAAQASNVRLRNKQKNAWRCDKCAVKIVQLTRVFGTWPNTAFKKLSDDQKLDFYSQLQNCSTQTAVEVFTDKFMKSYEAHEEFYAEGGEFLPLQVWATRGFDADRIRERTPARDIRPHSVLGDTFRVTIMSGGKRGWQGVNREETDKSCTKRRLKAAAEPEPADSGASGSAAPPPPPEFEDSSSSSSSSSSSRHKKHKKHKKHNKHKREETRSEKWARERAEKASARQLEKAAETSTKLAGQVSEKLSPVFHLVRSVMSHPRFNELPVVTRDAVTATIGRLDSLQADCDKITSGDYMHGITGVTKIADLRAIIASARKNGEWALQMLSMIGRQ